MYKAVGFLFLALLFSYSSSPALGQVTGGASRSPNTEAKRLLQEGIALTGAGHLPQAVLALEEAVKLDPHYADAYSALGRAYFKMRQWRRAVENLHRATALNAEQRQAKHSPQQQSATAKPATIAAPLQVTTSTPQPEKQPAESQVSIPPALELPPPTILTASTLTQRVPDPGSTTTSTSATTEAKVVEVAQPDPPELTASNEISPANSNASTASEETQEPTGVNVSMSAPAVLSSKVESSGVSPIPLKPSNEDVSLTKIYRVGPGDVLDVRINEAPPGQSTLFTITPAGLLEHPILAAPLSVSALTTEEIERKIQDDLKKRALSEDPEVIVGVRDYASHTILVSGLVKDSGAKILRREAIPLYVVVADAQPLPEAARVTVVRNELGQMFEVSLTEVEDMSLLVRPGDVINLLPNETQFIYVGGEVKAPGEKIFRRGLTLTQAIISAGGVTQKSKVAEIGRDDGRGFLGKTSFSLKDIQSGKTMDPLIQPGDRIMILR